MPQDIKRAGHHGKQKLTKPAALPRCNRIDLDFFSLWR
jgi:hypothetical protein